jgi:hypothetical protein
MKYPNKEIETSAGIIKIYYAGVHRNDNSLEIAFLLRAPVSKLETASGDIYYLHGIILFKIYSHFVSFKAEETEDSKIAKEAVAFLQKHDPDVLKDYPPFKPKYKLKKGIPVLDDEKTAFKYLFGLAEEYLNSAEIDEGYLRQKGKIRLNESGYPGAVTGKSSILEADRLFFVYYRDGETIREVNMILEEEELFRSNEMDVVEMLNRMGKELPEAFKEEIEKTDLLLKEENEITMKKVKDSVPEEFVPKNIAVSIAILNEYYFNNHPK